MRQLPVVLAFLLLMPWTQSSMPTSYETVYVLGGPKLTRCKLLLRIAPDVVEWDGKPYEVNRTTDSANCRMDIYGPRIFVTVWRMDSSRNAGCQYQGFIHICDSWQFFAMKALNN